MTNQIISILTKDNEIAFVLYTEDIGKWYWVVDKSDIETYKGDIFDFVNDEQNETIGYSVASFDTYEETIDDIGDEWEEMENSLRDAIESTNDLDKLGKIITNADTFGYYGLGDMAFEKINNIKQENGIED